MINRPLLFMLLLAVTMALIYQASATESRELRELIRAQNGKQACAAIRRAGEQELTGQAADLLAEATVLPSLINLWQSGATLDRRPNSTETGKELIVIQATPTDTSSIYTFYLHTENFRVLHYTQLDADGTKIRTTLDDY
jgi:hypothetical protein